MVLSGNGISVQYLAVITNESQHILRKANHFLTAPALEIFISRQSFPLFIQQSHIVPLARSAYYT